MLMKTNNLFTERLNSLMQEKGLKQKDLVKMLNTSSANVSRYCTGKVNPSIQLLSHIAKTLNVSPLWLGGLSDDRDDKHTKNKIVNKLNILTEEQLSQVLKFIDNLILK